MNAFSCFVTGTDTEIGKTLVSGALVHAQCRAGVRAVGMKPLAAGAEMVNGVLRNEDVDFLYEAGQIKLPRELTTPYLFRAPVAPHIAAVLESQSIEPRRIVTAYEQVRAQVEAVVVEGVGGWRVPLTPSYDTSDLARQLGLPVILVVGLRLGCINHALLTAEAIAARGLRLAGWVANAVDPAMAQADGNVEAIAARLSAPLLGRIPRLATPSAAAAAAYLDLGKVKTDV